MAVGIKLLVQRSELRRDIDGALVDGCADVEVMAVLRKVRKRSVVIICKK